MTGRQHAHPVLLSPDGTARALPLAQSNVPEAALQNLIFAHPECLPITEIDPLFAGAIPVCTELNTRAGPIDILLITPSGLPVIVECKLWRNPEGRREVVGQIIDYAKELSRWTCSDLQREVSRRCQTSLLELVRTRDASVDEVAFNDALTLNLRRGRFLLLIVGDGIRQGVEAIAEYLQGHAGLHFTLGLVELPIYDAPDGALLFAPRILARTQLLTHTVVEVPQGYALASAADVEHAADMGELDTATQDRVQFWSDFLAGLKLDDSEQPVPRAPKQGYISIPLPVPAGNCWLNVYRDLQKGEVGIGVAYTRGSLGEQAVRQVLVDWDDIRTELGGSVTRTERDGKPRVYDWVIVGNLKDPAIRMQGIEWLQARTNDFVNAFRPRIRSAMQDLKEGSQ